MLRRNFIALAAGTAVAALVPLPKPRDHYQEFLDSVGQKVHTLVLREGRGMQSVSIDAPFEMDGSTYWRFVRVELEGSRHAWFERATYL